MTVATKTQKRTMLAVQKPGPQPGFKLIQAEIPSPGPDEVLIKIALASVCGTDFHITNWDEWSAGRIKPPLIYGHEFCGFVSETGTNVKTFAPGDYVSAEMHLTCETCRQCKAGNKHICENVKIYGIDLNGCYAEYIVVAARQVVKLPQSIKPEYGAFLDSLGNAVHAVSKVDVRNQVVHVVGCGPIGLFAIEVAKAMGARAVYASDVAPFRINLAQKAGATEVFAADKVKVSDEIKKLTDGEGVAVVFEMSGSAPAIADALVSLQIGGTMVMMGIPKSPVEIDLNKDVIFKEAKLIGCNGRQIFGTWHLMLQLLDEGKLDLDFIITHHLKLDEFGTAMDLIKEGISGKILLEP